MTEREWLGIAIAVVIAAMLLFVAGMEWVEGRETRRARLQHDALQQRLGRHTPYRANSKADQR
jgi:uncharacterized membrane protein